MHPFYISVEDGLRLYIVEQKPLELASGALAWRCPRSCIPQCPGERLTSSLLKRDNLPSEILGVTVSISLVAFRTICFAWWSLVCIVYLYDYYLCIWDVICLYAFIMCPTRMNTMSRIPHVPSHVCAPDIFTDWLKKLYIIVLPTYHF